MKLNRMITLCATALALSAASVWAQDDNGGGPGRGGPGGRRGNFNPAQFQQRIMDNIRDELNFTNDTDWSAVQPLVQKVLDARRDADSGSRLMRSMFRRRGGGRSGDDNHRSDRNYSRRGGPGGMFGQPSPEQEALQKALDNNAPAAQIKDLLAKFQAAQKAKRDKLTQAQADLRGVLNSRQEAEATLMGLLD